MVKFKYYSKGTDYDAAVSNESIKSDDIVFISDRKILHTHGTDFISANGVDYQAAVAAMGSTTKPVYVSTKGTFSECSTYAGGTAVTLNGASKAASTASFYAPTSAGTSGQILKSSGSGAPTWVSLTDTLGNYVSSIGGKTGAITLDTTTSTAKEVKFAISSDGKISGSVQGLGSAATVDTESTVANDTKVTTGAAVTAYAMPKAGGTFTGAVTLNGAPTSNLHAATKKYVDDEIASKIAAADAMVFKGTLGTGGNVTTVPTTNVTKGDTYKVITAGTWAGSVCKVGDLLIALNSGASLTANTTNWAYVPSGNENETTVKIAGSGDTVNVSTTAQTGAVVFGAAAAKGVTDNSTATAVTSSDTNLITARTLYNAGYTKNVGTITGITMNGSSKGTSGVINLGTVITDVSDKQDKVSAMGSATKPVYVSADGTFSECDSYPTIPGVFSTSANGLAPMTSSSNITTAESSSSVNYLCSDGKWRPLPAGAWKNGTVTSTAHTITVISGKKSDGTTNISATSSSATSPSVTLGDSGVTAGSYGDSSAQTPAHEGTFKVPYVTVNAKGIVTGISEHTVTLPSDSNTDTKVTQNAAITTAGEYPVILGYSTATTAVTNTVNKASAFTYNPNTTVLTVTKIKGASGDAAGVADMIAALTWEDHISNS